MTTTYNNFKKMSLGLKKFGLNPQDWQPKKANDSKIIFKNRKDASFELVGTLPPSGELRIIDLSLLSI